MSEITMVPELEELQRKKTELENELQSLSRKEEILSAINEGLEERLIVKSEEKIMPGREFFSEFADAQVSLERLEERFNKPEVYSKGVGEVRDQQSDRLVKEQIVPLETGLRLESRVRLKGNVVFSWSYQKLS